VPALIFADSNKPNYIAVASDRTDGEGRPSAIVVELDCKQDWRNSVNRVTTMYGRRRVIEPFVARNGEEDLSYSPVLCYEPLRALSEKQAVSQYPP
jgi:hypothetical protein